MIIFTKFHEYKTKDVDFLFMVHFLTCLVFFAHTLLNFFHFVQQVVQFKILLLLDDNFDSIFDEKIIGTEMEAIFWFWFLL